MSKKITIKTEKVLAMFNVLNNAKYGKLEDADKIKLWKITRTLKPIATKFEEDTKDASEKFKQGFDKFDERLQQAQEFERVTKDKDADTSKLKMGAAEHDAFIKGDWTKYNKLVADAVDEYAKKENKITIEPISEEAFGKLMSSNDWTFGQVDILDIITE
jgi:hypothetical protein